MDKSPLRTLTCQFYRRIRRYITKELDEQDLGRSAVIFSPHFDDETLGCGGTILKKRKAGANVKIVFMTDGSKSHRHLISEHELTVIRSNEGLAVSRLLGLSECDVFFLDFEETKLHEHKDNAITRVAEILLQQKPEEVFIPYYKERPSDHFITNGIVLSALRTYKRNVVVYEYPIWFWQNWPWTNVSKRGVRRFFGFLRDTILSGLRFFIQFRCSVYIGDVLDIKRSALDQYKSQMTRLLPNLRWLTLNDVSDGEFLKCFFQEYEIFYQYHLGGENGWIC